MARGLHLDAAALLSVIDDPCNDAGDSRSSLDRGGCGTRETVFFFVRASSKTALPSRIYRTEYHVRIIRSTSPRSSFTEGNRERDRFEYSAREKFDHDRPLRSFARSLPLVSRSPPSAKTFFSADVDDELSSLELGSGSRYAPLKVLSDDCAKKSSFAFFSERENRNTLSYVQLNYCKYVNHAYKDTFFQLIKISKQQKQTLSFSMFFYIYNN